MYLESTTVAGEEKMLQEELAPAARGIASAHPELVIFGCTSAAALHGLDGDDAIACQVETIAGCPCITVVQAAVREIRGLGVRRLLLVTPHIAEINDRLQNTFEEAGLRVIGVPLGPRGFESETLERLLIDEKPTLFYIIPDFQNPTGITTSLDKRETLVALAERHGFWVLEDSPYRDLRYWGEEVSAIFSLGSEKVLHLSSFSKVLSSGMRVGYILGPEHVVSALAKIAEDTYITPNMVSQGLVFEYCQRGWLGPNIERLKSLYRPRLGTLASALQAYLPQAQWTRPEGGFFVGAYLPSGVDVSLLKAKAHEERVTLSDGRGFFPDEDGSAFLRLPFCALSAPNIQEGISRLGSIVNMLIR